jgi:hypothetical protein
MKLFYQIFTKRTLLSILFIHFFLLNFGATYYVSSTGNDNNSGLTTSLPWKTIAKVNASTFKEGDEILFKKGDTWRETLTVPSSGTSGRPIIFGAYGTGVNPVMDGSEILSLWTSEVVGAGSGVKEQQTTANQGTAIFKRGDRVYNATQFIATSTYDLSKIEVNLSKVGSPVQIINCYLYSDSAENPTTLLATSSTTLDASTITNGNYYAFTFDQSFKVQNGTTYWIVLKGSTTSSTDYVSWNAMAGGGDIKSSTDGTGTWSEEIAWHTSYKVTGIADQFTCYYATCSVAPNVVYSNGVEVFKKQVKSLGTNSWWYDSVNHRLYIRTSGDNIPTGYTINVPQRDYGINSNNKDCFTVSGLNIQYMNRYGILVDITSDHINISDNTFNKNGFGVHVLGTNVLITRNIISNGHIIVDDLSPDNDFGAVGVNIQGSNVEVSYNTFSNLYAPSTDYGEDGGGIEIFQDGSTVDNINIHHNKFTNTSGLVEMGGSGGIVQNVSFYYNLILDDTHSPSESIDIHNSGGIFGITAINISFYNNTFISNGSGSGAYMIYLDSYPASSTLILKNNIFYASNMVAMSNYEPNTHINNDYYNTSDLAWSVLGYSKGASEIKVDPSFVDIATDLHLQLGSPCINAGVNVGLTQDYAGNPIVGIPDIGAYEFGATNKDTEKPTVTGFTIPATSTSQSVLISSFTATDNMGVTGYLLTETSTTPSVGASGWSSVKPTQYTFSSIGAKTLYAWTKDAAGNVSASLSASVTISYPITSTFTFTGPSSGNVNSASTIFTVTPNNLYTGTITITPTGTGSTGLSAKVLTFSNSSASQTYTITPTVAGSITLTPTNNGSITNPSNLTYTANAVVPGAPNSVIATPGNASASVTFVATTNNGGSAITGYTVTSIPSGGVDSNAGSTLLNHTITGLNNGTSYTFTILATNSVGNSVTSMATNPVTPKALSATTFTFTGPSSGSINSASTIFTVTPNNLYTGTITITLTGTGSAGLSAKVLTFSNSSASQTYTITPTVAGSITLTATNNGSLTNPGNLTYSSNAIAPDAPTSVVATAEDASASVTFVATTNNGGSAITGYTVTSIPTGGTDINDGSTLLNHTITGLTNGTSYSFLVKAINPVGSSSFSVASNSIIIATGITNLDDKVKIVVFPNPCHGHFTIRFSEIPISGSRIEVLNLSGRKVTSQIISGISQEIDLFGHAPGMYFVKSILGSIEKIDKLVIQ